MGNYKNQIFKKLEKRLNELRDLLDTKRKIKFEIKILTKRTNI